MKIVIAPDSFKESLSAAQAAEAIRRGVAAVFPQAEYVCVPMADGGEGTVASVMSVLGGEWVSVQVEGPLGEQITAYYGLLPDGTALMEMAEASGLHLVKPEERNPLLTSTYGTGQMMADALRRGVPRIMLGIGGSASNDGGAGMLQALGFRLLDGKGIELPRGGAFLADLAQIDATGALPALANCRIVAACDVDNPLCGEWGASAVFGPQKGANAMQIQQLDAALSNYADVVAAGGWPDSREEAGSGAAGGLGFGLRAVLGAELQRGVDWVISATGLAAQLTGADLVITGEGRMDGQTAFGKVPLGVAAAAQTQGVPVIALAGSVAADVSNLAAYGFCAIFPSVARPAGLAEVLAEADGQLERTAKQVASVWRLGREQGSRRANGS